MELGASPGSVLKADVLAAISAIDDFLDSNATAVNNAFPTAFRNAASTPQKALVVAIVALKRAGLLHLVI